MSVGLARTLSVVEKIDRARELYRSENDLDYIAKVVGLPRHIVFLSVNSAKIKQLTVAEGLTRQHSSFVRTNVRKRLTFEEIARNAKTA